MNFRNILSKSLLLGAFTFLAASCGEEGDCLLAADCGPNMTCDITDGVGTCVDVPPEDCTLGSCQAGQVCNLVDGTCAAPAACSDANAQPDTCTYGQFCEVNTCAEVALPADNCTNFGGSGHAATWGGDSTGPVIYEVVLAQNPTKSATDPVCGDTYRYRVDVKAYRTSGAWAGADGTDALETSIATGFHLVAPDGAEIDNPQAAMQNAVLTNDGKHVAFRINYCRTTNDAYSAGMHFADGNEYCQTIE